MALETESKVFEMLRNDLVKTHVGQYALIKGDRLDGTFTTFMEAYEAGVRAYGLAQFMVRIIAPDDQSVLIPALNAGLIFTT